MPTYYPINEEAARRAKEMNSFHDYRPGSATEEYRQSVDQASAIASAQKARVDPMYHEKINRLLDLYARKLAENLNQSYDIAARCPSILIAGPASFPARKKEKQNRSADANMAEWRSIQGILDKIRGTGMGGVSSDDGNAIEKLQQKVAGLEQRQEMMKAVNAFYRNHGTLDGCPSLTPEEIEEREAAMSRSPQASRKPFKTFELTNNRAVIRQTRARIAELEALRNAPALEGWAFPGGEVIMNREENRVQLFFAEKPDEVTRSELKHSGFRWSPSQKAWQRMLNQEGIRAAKRVTEKWMTNTEQTDAPITHQESDSEQEPALSSPQQTM